MENNLERQWQSISKNNQADTSINTLTPSRTLADDFSRRRE